MLTGIPLLLVIALSIVLIVVLTSRFKAHPFLALIIACFFVGIASGMPLDLMIGSIQSGFGILMQYIGIIVIFGSVIGVFLEKSGGAMRIAQQIISLTGKLIKLIRGKRKKKNKEETIPPSSYKDFKNLFEEDNIFTNELLTEELGIPLAYKSLFFDYLDGQAIPSDLRKEENHFQLLDRLFTESENFKILIETAKKEGED